MKKVITIIIAIAIVLSCFSAYAEDYTIIGVVAGLDVLANEITIVDSNGAIWTWEGVEEWSVGIIFLMRMDTCETKQIEDDEIQQLDPIGFMELEAVMVWVNQFDYE